MFAASKTAGASAGGSTPENQFNYVTMLLHGDGTNGAQNNTFLDSSTNAFSITRNGNTTQGSFSPYGSNWSNYFGGADYISVPQSTAFDLTTGDWTVEGWVNPNSISGSAASNTIWANKYPVQIYAQNNNVALYVSSTNATGTYIVNPALGPTSSLVVGVWSHFACVKSGNNYTVYVNGVAGTTVTTATAPAVSNSVSSIGSWNNASAYFTGYISNLRIVKGTAVYTSNFTPPTVPLTDITNTSLLTCQSNRFIDNGFFANPLTIGGSPSVQRFNPFGTSTAYSTSVIGGSGYFDGSGDYLTASATNIANFGTGDFIVSAWFNSTTTGSYQKIFDNYNGNNNVNPTIIMNIAGAGKISWYAGQSPVVSSSLTYIPNTWNYVVVSRVSSTTKMFLNGTEVGSVADTRTYVAGNANVGIGGEPYSSGGAPMVGYITDLQVVKGSGVTSSTVPTAPVSASGSTLHLGMTNGAIFDNAMINNLETVGNAQISTSVVKYGTGSLAFDGTGDYLLAPVASNQNFNFGTSDFTVEMWFYANSLSASNYAALCGCNTGIDTSEWGAYVRSNGVFFFGASGTLTGGGTIATSTWYHFAATRSGTTVRVFLNGVQQASATTSGSYINGSTGFRVGDDSDAGNPAFNGYIDDLRITKGYARYTANFTAPTAAFPNTGPI
jgi:hypothetical protein